jgi:hypothetical protein
MSSWPPERRAARASRCRCQPAAVVVSVVLGPVVSGWSGDPGIVLVRWRRVWSPSGSSSQVMLVRVAGALMAVEPQVAVSSRNRGSSL